MSDVVFILGAGASRECGAPLMTDFLDVARDLLLSNEVGDSAKDFNCVFDTIGKLQAVHSKSQLDLENIESIFTALELGRVIRRVADLTVDEIEQAISSLRQVIRVTLESTIRFPVRDGRFIVPPHSYEAFVDLLTHLIDNSKPSHSVSVITFNYDIALDVAMHHAGLDPAYAVGPSYSARRAIPLLKLHGSLNWATETEANAILPLHLREYFKKYSLNSGSGASAIRIPIGAQLQEAFRSHFGGKVVDSDPVIVPPSWNKADYHNALSSVWSEAAKHLSEAAHIFVIGYSLPETDAFFRHLFALGSVGRSPLRRFSVHNPDNSGAVDKRFRALLGPGALARYQYFEETFTLAVERVRSLFPDGKR